MKRDIGTVILIFNPVDYSIRKPNVTTRYQNLVRMFLRVRIIVVCACIGIGMPPQSSFASPPGSGKDFMSIFRSGKSPVAESEKAADSATASSSHRLARMYAEQNDIHKANDYYGRALKNASPKLVPVIASDYAVFLLNIGDLHKADLILRQALTQSPHDVELTKMLARCLVRQDKMMEGLRVFKSVLTEAESREEIAAIYRNQGNIEMLAAVEKKWGPVGTTSIRSAPIRSEPVLITSAPKPMTLPSVSYAQTIVPPSPAVIASTVRNVPPSPITTPPRVVTLPAVLPKKDDTVIAATPVLPPTMSKSEFFDTKVPIPVPNTPPQPMVAMTVLPKRAPVASAPVPMLPTPIPVAKQHLPEKSVVAEKAVLDNPVRLAMVPKPMPTLVEDREPPRPAVSAVQPRRHYVVSAGSASDLDALFPVKSVAATVRVQQ
jgi:hypothetical protein